MKKICVLTILLHLVVGCMFAINYPTYNPDHVDRSGGAMYRASTVGMTFRASSGAAIYSQMTSSSAYRSVEPSTSAVGFGAISAVPTIGSNGCATAPYRASMGGDDDDDDDDDNGGFIPTPTTPQTPTNQVPVGDCVFPLLLAALFFAIGKKSFVHRSIPDGRLFTTDGRPVRL